MKQVRIFMAAFLCLLGHSLAITENHCARNVTVKVLVPVTKERTVVRQASKWKIWKKAQTFTETYNTHEEQIIYKLVFECCPGYLHVESGLCEPVCDRGCPAHASCVEPQRCQCIPGYVSAVAHRDNSHYCEPICEMACSKGAHCVAPSTCECKEGFMSLTPSGDAVSPHCEPICTVGNGCEHGECIDVERCHCHFGYQWSMESQKCEELQGQILLDEVTELEEYLASTSVGTTAAAAAPAAAPSNTPLECSKGFVLYGGVCRAEVFESNELAKPKNCAESGCGPHQTCTELGNCSCVIGYVEDQPQTANTTLICSRSLLESLLSIDSAADDEDEINFWTIPIVGVASGTLFVLVIVGFFNFRPRPENSEEGDESQPQAPVLQCEFTQKSYDVDEWVP